MIAVATIPDGACPINVTVTAVAPEQFAAGPASTRVWVAPLDFCGDAAFDAALMALLT